MNADQDPHLEDASRAGVYFVGMQDLDVLAAYAFSARLVLRRIDLLGVRDKQTLLLRVAVALDFPLGTGRNWDGLLDGLRDLSWLPGAGYVLLLESAGELHARNEADFDTLVSVLDQAQLAWRERGLPFWAFLALRDKDMDALED
ncbi:barstar family protein [Pseudoxanthomonas winnipegensis]|uniref:Barnase inhibitor n=1 Tax=Pseudoxanthomonas winnipegensis TaxID=2480810 RepID=A0A4Q8LJ49_9GAMM|nr:barstar family protein [Pseudoxanthomonas winnipegensis]RZZ87872.1 barnase inhibitor [Pseudoxanthomonas winnipegensis]TAA30009.1 barnase inhibitor [Pseudoxanthomonas winnipegensis]TAA36945.1 barnase inhibitor [Pseudoxanthomonas winnipegensis]TBV78151.1 barnase inhibitor [Pseudoxanthomonas winnipegensis]